MWTEKRCDMSAELIGILGVGVALAGLLLSGQRGLGSRMDRLDARMDKLEVRITALEHGQAELRERMARLEGLLDGLREAISARATPAA